MTQQRNFSPLGLEVDGWSLRNIEPAKMIIVEISMYFYLKEALDVVKSRARTMKLPQSALLSILSPFYFLRHDSSIRR